MSNQENNPIGLLENRIQSNAETASRLREAIVVLSAINDRKPPETRVGTHVYDTALWALDRVVSSCADRLKVLEDIAELRNNVVYEDVHFFERFADTMVAHLSSSFSDTDGVPEEKQKLAVVVSSREITLRLTDFGQRWDEEQEWTVLFCRVCREEKAMTPFTQLPQSEDVNDVVNIAHACMSHVCGRKSGGWY